MMKSERAVNVQKRATMSLEEVNKVMEEVVEKIEEKVEEKVEEKAEGDVTVPKEEEKKEEEKGEMELVSEVVKKLTNELFQHQEITHEELDKLTKNQETQISVTNELNDAVEQLKLEVMRVKQMLSSLHREQESQGTSLGEIEEKLRKKEKKKEKKGEKRSLSALETLQMLDSQLSKRK